MGYTLDNNTVQKKRKADVKSPVPCFLEFSKAIQGNILTQKASTYVTKQKKHLQNQTLPEEKMPEAQEFFFWVSDISPQKREFSPISQTVDPLRLLENEPPEA